MRCAILAGLLLFAPTSWAATLVATNEAPLSDPAISSAEGAQTAPSMAWYGNSVATTWVDIRESPNGGIRTSSIRITQLDSLGRPKEIAARLAGSLDQARIAATGRATPLIATQKYGSWMAVGPAGNSGRRVDGALQDLITNGTTYLLTASDWPDLYGTILDDHGETLHTVHVESSGPSEAIAIGSDYHVIRIGKACGAGCDYAVQDVIIHSDGTSEDHTLIPHISPTTSIAAAANGGEILIAWTEANDIQLLELTPALSLIARRTVDVHAQDVQLASDGEDFLLAWLANDSLQAAPITASALNLGSPFTLRANGRGSGISSVRTPDGIVIGWSDWYNVYTRGAANVAALAAAPTTLASIGIIQQQDLSVRDLPVWIEGEFRSSVVSSRGTVATAAPGHTLHTPRGATGGGSSIVAWCDFEGGLQRIMARANEDSPLVIGEGHIWSSVDVLFDGTSFVVAWTSDGHVFETRILPSGTRLDTTEIASSGSAHSVKVAHFGSTVGITFVELGVIFYSSDGHVRPVAAKSNFGRASLAFDDRGEPVVTWLDQGESNNCLWTAHALDGLFAAQSLYCSGTSLVSSAIEWSGSEFVIAFDEIASAGYHTLRILRTTRRGILIDGPFTLSLPFRETFAPSLTSSPAGVVLGYQRVAGEEPFDDVSRVFTRTLLRKSNERVRTVPH